VIDLLVLTSQSTIKLIKLKLKSTCKYVTEGFMPN